MTTRALQREDAKALTDSMGSALERLIETLYYQGAGNVSDDELCDVRITGAEFRAAVSALRAAQMAGICNG